MTTVGLRIKQRREEIGLTQEALAKKLGYRSKSTINKIEMGINDITQSKIISFADALNTSPGYLMGWEDEEKIADSLFSLTTSPELQRLIDIVSDMRSELINKVIDYAEYIKTKEEG